MTYSQEILEVHSGAGLPSDDRSSPCPKPPPPESPPESPPASPVVTGRLGGAPALSAQVAETPYTGLDNVRQRAKGDASVMTTLRNYFIAGLAFAIPLVATGWLLILVYKAIEKVSTPLVALLLPKQIDPPGLVVSVTGFLTIVLIILGLGFMARNVIGKRVLAAVDLFFLGIPVIAFVYRGLKQAIESFRTYGTARRFQRVAYVEYPAPGSRMIGFVTGSYLDPQIGKEVTTVFVPTSPNPITGFVIVVENEFVMESNLSLEEATKLVFSAGLISPYAVPPSTEVEGGPALSS